MWTSTPLLRLGQGFLQELQGSFRLLVLFVDEVIQDVLVPLDQSLGVQLSVHQLLVPVSLNSFEESSQGELLGVS